MRVCRKPVAEFVSAIEALTPSDISKAVTTLLKSSPSFACVGETASVPRYDQLVKRFS